MILYRYHYSRGDVVVSLLIALIIGFSSSFVLLIIIGSICDTDSRMIVFSIYLAIALIISSSIWIVETVKEYSNSNNHTKH